jgi:hypothetical protein
MFSFPHSNTVQCVYLRKHIQHIIVDAEFACTSEYTCENFMGNSFADTQ